MPLTPSLRRGLLLGVLLAVVSGAPARAAVFPPSAHPYGKSYGEWSAKWWKQAVRAGAEPGEPLAQGAVDCASLGVRRVIFLVGTTGGTATRSCEVPRGTAFLLPLVNGECSELEGNGSTEAELRRCANELAESIDVESLFVVVDGVPIERLEAFRFESGLFTWRAAIGNAFGFPAGTRTLSVADGFYVMLKPLRPGTHTLQFGGTAADGQFTTSTQYDITVTTKSKHDRRLAKER